MSESKDYGAAVSCHMSLTRATAGARSPAHHPPGHEQAGPPRQQVAERMGVTQGSVSQIEQGRISGQETLRPAPLHPAEPWTDLYTYDRPLRNG
jgi:transcriptional regulator with XRE-family HTH domain